MNIVTFEPSRAMCLPARGGPPVPRPVAAANAHALAAVLNYEEAPAEEARERACERVLALRHAIHVSPTPVAMPAALAEIPWR